MGAGKIWKKEVTMGSNDDLENKSNSNMTFIVLNLYQKTNSKVPQPRNTKSKKFIDQRRKRGPTTCFEH